jgi:hypothetical protein
MRIPLLLCLLALALVPAAHAQDACTQSSPCAWDVAVDSPGFVGESEWNWTAGDWMRVTIFNDDDAAHTVALSGYNLQFQVPPLEERSQVVHLTQAGHFQLSDAPSNDTVSVTVVDGDVVDYEKGLIDAGGNTVAAKSSSGRVPGLELPLLAAALAVAALARRSP